MNTKQTTFQKRLEQNPELKKAVDEFVENLRKAAAKEKPLIILDPEQQANVSERSALRQ